MSTPTSNSVPFSNIALSGDNNTDALIMGTKWGGALGTSVALTYSFPAAATSWWSTIAYPQFATEPWSGFTAFSASYQTAAVAAMNSWAAVANITFSQVADDINTVGEIRFASTAVGGGQAHVGDFPSSSPKAADVWFNSSVIGGSVSPGSYNYSTLIHELGHALGLKHTFTSTGSSTAILPSNEDGLALSVMSYTAAAGHPGSSVNFEPTTPMYYDIKAIQYLYGANTSYHSGNDVYNFYQGQSYFQTIWDGGGTDTIVWNAGSESALIDLRSSHWSDLGNTLTYSDGGGVFATQVSTVMIYETVTIENATGGDGNDTLIGNDVNNALSGGAGVDTILGFAGNDTLDGGTGADGLAGGVGDDTYVVDDNSDFVAENASEGTDLIQASVTYTLAVNIENLTLTGGAAINGTGNTLNNALAGNSGNNILDGNVGNDTLDGGIGADTLIGGDGSDLYVIDNASDVVTENNNEGTDTVQTTLNSFTLDSNLENLTFIGAGDFTGTGNNLNNIITGGSGNDTLDGSSGTDTLAGGLGNDTYIVDNTGDVVSDTGGTDLVQSSVTYTLVSGLENLTLTGGSAINGTGNDLNNIITGNAVANTMDGNTGADTLIGGDGGDTYIVDNTSDVVTENSNEGTDLVQSSVAYTLVVNVENLTLTGTAVVNGTGNDLNNIITGNSVANTLDGGIGADTLIGGDGSDLYVIDNASDVVTENNNEGTDTVQTTLNSFTLDSNLENLTFIGAGDFTGTGNNLNNILTGGTGNDTLDGGSGADAMNGGLGNDTYLVDDTNDVISDSGGTDAVSVSSTYTLSSGLENLTLTGSSAINGTGNAANNTITGNSGENILNGGSGADTLIGGDDDDTYVVDNADDIVIEDDGEGTDQVQASVSHLLSEHVENLTLTGSNTADGDGNDLNNIIIGNSAANVLNGMAGADTLIGGAGNDTYIVDDLDDVITEDTSAGTDTIATTLTSFILATNFENLTYTDGGNFSGTGNTTNNILTGGIGNDTLDGGIGADTMNGGLGDDRYTVDNIADVIIDAGGTDTLRISTSYTLSSGIENLILLGAALIGTGESGANQITGNVNANTLNGLGGDDTLDGGNGLDKLNGGIGNDTYIVDLVLVKGAAKLEDAMKENAGEGGDTLKLRTSGDLGLATATTLVILANMENLDASETGTNKLNLTGNAFDNILTGNDEDNALNGMVGADTLIGGDGNDTYVVDNAGDVVTENFNEGTDLIQSSISHTLGSDLENLTLIGTAAINGTGNDLDNVITGNKGANVLDGGIGADSLIGGAGNDTYVADADDVITEIAKGGVDLVQVDFTYVLADNLDNLTLTGTDDLDGTGNILANLITGNSGENILDGGAGKDTLIGGSGADLLMGGLDSDSLVGGDDNDTLSGGAGKDTINGGLGDDVFLFDSALSKDIDTIIAFGQTIGDTDVFQLSLSIFTALTGLGTLDITEFFSGVKALETDDRIGYDSIKGKLYYDADGSGAVSKIIQIALIGTTLHPTFAHTDFVVVA